MVYYMYVCHVCLFVCFSMYHICCILHCQVYTMYILPCILYSLYSTVLYIHIRSIICNVVHHAVHGQNPALVGMVKRL